jgi:SAM-dependent methyltransferase
LNVKRHDSKRLAWDLIGEQFWAPGNAADRPSARETGLLVEGVQPGHSCAILGASTKDVVEEAVARSADVVVIDFSRGMLRALRTAIGPSGCLYVLADVLDPPVKKLRGRFDVVCADRLVNRFLLSEVPGFLRTVLRLLRPGGLFRTTVRIGFHPIDEALFALGRANGRLPQFFDARARTIDFSKARPELEVAVPRHPAIDRAIQMTALTSRGKESRFFEGQIEEALRTTSLYGHRLRLVGSSWCPDTPKTRFFTVEKYSGRPEGRPYARTRPT